MIKATFETAQWTFESYANTELEALMLLHNAWYKYAEDSGADEGYLEEYECDVWYEKIELGKVYMR